MVGEVPGSQTPTCQLFYVAIIGSTYYAEHLRLKGAHGEYEKGSGYLSAQQSKQIYFDARVVFTGV